MSDGFRRIAEFIASNPGQASASTINDLARLSKTSPATVNRLSRMMGFHGYSDFRLAIATDSGRSDEIAWQKAVGTEVQPDDPVARIAAKVANSNIRAIKQTADGIDLDQLESVLTLLLAARRIHSFGVGGSFLAAEELRHRLNLIGLPIWSWNDVHEGLSAVSILGSTDVLVAFSYTGKTVETNDVLCVARKAGASTIAVTNFSDSHLAIAADYVLVTNVAEPEVLRSQAQSARHSQMYLVDLLYVLMVNSMYDESLQNLGLASQAVQTQVVEGAVPRKHEAP